MSINCQVVGRQLLDSHYLGSCQSVIRNVTKQERNTSTMVQMDEDNIFQQKMPFSNLFANGVVTYVVVMKCEWELDCQD